MLDEAIFKMIVNNMENLQMVLFANLSYVLDAIFVEQPL